MIFIGAELSDPHAHFVTNVVECIGTGEDLVIDLLKVSDSEVILGKIASHLQSYDERYVIYNAYTNESFFVDLKDRFPELLLITVFSDDEWRHSNYDRYLALYSDVFTIAVKDNLDSYRSYGLSPFYMQWACNPEMFYPLPKQSKDIDVSFIGGAYGQRVTYIKFLIANGIKVKVFGRDWDRYADIRPFWGGYLSHKEMLEVIAKSKINLNFLWTSAKKEQCTIKGRTMELSACRAFQLSNTTDEFLNYGFVDGKNIAIFEDEQEVLQKIRYYLENDNKRDVIARKAYEHVLKHHTWKQRFHSIFECLENRTNSFVPIHHKSKVLVVVKQGVQHQINTCDDRFNISIVGSASDWQKTVMEMDGVVYLDCDSSIDNETLGMMLFGIVADNSDMAVANFYVGKKKSRYWIRVIDRMLERKRSLLRILPAPCFMFSGRYAAKNGCMLSPELAQLNVSYIEYPSFWISFSYYRLRKLRFYFAYHGDSRRNLKAYLQSFNFGRALSLIVDKIWQHWLQKKLGY